jgi:HSP20 family protein
MSDRNALLLTGWQGDHLQAPYSQAYHRAPVRGQAIVEMVFCAIGSDRLIGRHGACLGIGRPALTSRVGGAHDLGARRPAAGVNRAEGEVGRMKALIPSNGISVLRKEMDRLFDRIWEGGVPEVTMPLGEWTPALDISESEDAMIVKAEVPGIEPKDIHVTLNNQILSIAGEKKFESEKKDETFYRMERSSGSFARTINLPVAVDSARVTAVFKNGILTITMPKTAAAKGSVIPIKYE